MIKLITDKYLQYIIIFLLLSSVVLFILGLLNPLLATKQQILGVVLKYQEIKLFDSVIIFFNDNSFFFASIILLFTIIFPIIKYFELYNRIYKTINLPTTFNIFLRKLDKWSMLDVFIVALLLLNFKINSSIIIMELKIGTTYIALSVLTRMLLVAILDIKKTHNGKKQKKKTYISN